MYLAKYVKQPRERKRYDVDWDCWLTKKESIILAQAEVIDLDGITPYKLKNKQALFLSGHLLVEDVYVATNNRSIYFYAERGKDGHSYKVTLRVTTDRSQIDEQEIIFDVVDY